jgi:NAD(P)-dependent dehydrogenase (short-subunit alcohol dehydrogenase family)
MPANQSLTEMQSFLWKQDSDEFTKTFAVNTTAVYFTAIAFLGLLGKGLEKGNVQQASQVITVASVASFNRISRAGFAYSASKAGVLHMMKQFATMFVPYGIRSNVIAPGCKF